MVHTRLLTFAGTAAATAFQTILLLLAVNKCRQTHCNSAYETKFRALKYGRTLTYAVLAACQGALVLWHAQSHWPLLAWDVDGAQLLVLLVYVCTFSVLCVQWKSQLSLQLAAVFLIALLAPGLLFWQDITDVQPDGTFDAEHVARVILHCVQFVMLLALLVAEVIIQQHQLLQRNSFGISHGALPVAGHSNRTAAGSYQQLPSSAAEAVDAQQQQQDKHWRQRRFTPWKSGDSRWRMAASAFHYVWPSEATLKLRLMLCLMLVLGERVINLAAPIAFKNMVEVLSAALNTHEDPATSSQQPLPILAGVRRLSMWLTQSHSHQPAGTLQDMGHPISGGPQHQAIPAAGVWAFLQSGTELAPFWVLFYPWVFVYLGAFFLRGGSGSEGLLANLRDILWIPITQAAFRRISNDVFAHLLELDLNFHVHRKTGQIMRILDRGTSSIQDTVSIILFNVMPQLIDILVACTYLASALKGPWVALIVFFTVGSYVPLTLLITEQRGKVRKVMNALDNERESRATDMLLNYETIKYFCAENLELDGYDTATRKYQAAEYWQMAFLSLLSLVQSLVVWLGLAAGLVFCVWGSSKGRVSVGDTVLFISMMQQLYVPLTFFGSYYRQVTKALIDMENMFELLATQPRVRDALQAATLQVRSGRVEFQQVVFSYNPSPAMPPVLCGLSFVAPGGNSLAVVGSTGSGKSTLLRLLLRFYDPQSGCVRIDGQDIRLCSQASVRSAIGVVPQDCVLFNDTIMYNIRYGRPAASDGQVYEAARVSHIHDHLMRFPQGYSTRVGERGLRLSGGEKQRVAFARAVLKAPAIMVLDEATSSLDSLTERLIQDSLAAIRGTCTQVIVAHRLSTIMDADQILVLDKGQVVESGSHAALVAAGGTYASMWARQQDSSVNVFPTGAKAAAAAANTYSRNTQDSNRSGAGDPTDGDSKGGSFDENIGRGCHTHLRKSEEQMELEEWQGQCKTASAGPQWVTGAAPTGYLEGAQRPAGTLPPLPRTRQQLFMFERQGKLPQQQQQQQTQQQEQQQQQLGLPERSSVQQHGSCTSSQQAAIVDGGSASLAGRGSRTGQSHPSHARPISKLRCNSSCGRGRHANFWSRDQVDHWEQEAEEEDQEDEEEQEEEKEEAGRGQVSGVSNEQQM